MPLRYFEYAISDGEGTLIDYGVVAEGQGHAIALAFVRGHTVIGRWHTEHPGTGE